LSPISRKKFIQHLQQLGFEGPYAGGKHPQMKRGTTTLIIPNEHEGDIGPGFLHRLLKQAGISHEEWND
jgi:predicted RNA binding protein YcfA (HicA-like mRNA interferase family)